MPGPLSGLTIVEMAGLGPAPFCGMMLADMGARVVRVDRAGPKPWGVDDTLGRGRRSIAVDLKKPGGAEIVLRLAAEANALIEGFRPGVMERLGLGPDICQARNPRLVYGRMTGWGQTGPLAQAPGHDINYLALSGMLWPIGEKDRPPVPPLNLVADFGGGGMMLALGVVAAMLSAKTTGHGQVVDAAMVDGSAVLGTLVWGMMGSGAWTRARGVNMLDGGAPFYGVYETADGGYVSIGSLEPQFYAALIEKLALDPARFAQQWDRRAWPDLKAALTATFKSKTRAEWCALLDGSDVCFAPVLDPVEAAEHPHARARAAFSGVPALPNPAPRFYGTPTRRAAPTGGPGADTREVLAEAGFAPSEIEAALAEGLVA